MDKDIEVQNIEESGVLHQWAGGAGSSSIAFGGASHCGFQPIGP